MESKSESKKAGAPKKKENERLNSADQDVLETVFETTEEDMFVPEPEQVPEPTEMPVSKPEKAPEQPHEPIKIIHVANPIIDQIRKKGQ